MPTVTSRDGTKLYVKDWGHGKPVILIHGWPLSSDSWDDQSMALAEAGYRAIAYDRRGFGRSDQPFQGYDYDTLADDLAAVVAYAQSEEVALVGFSMGGGEVARYMSRHEGKAVSHAVLISSVVPFLLRTGDNPEGVPQEVFTKMEKEMRDDRAGFFATFFKQFFGTSLLSHRVSAELLEWARNVGMQASLKATLACAKAFATTDFRADLAAFRVPTLVIHGTDDLTVPIAPTGRATAALVPGAKLIEYDGAPHGLFATEKERLTHDLLTFLGGL